MSTVPPVDPLDCCIVSPGLAHDGATLATKSLGGSETAAIFVAKGLAARGHHVTVFSPGSTGQVIDGVTWMPLEHAGAYCGSTPHDVTVVSRAIDALRVKFLSKVVALWCHDLFLKRGKGALCGVLWNLDVVYVLSQFHQRQAWQVNDGIPQELFQVTRNGVDLSAFKDIRLPRDPKKLVYGSRPERGLETALNLMDRLRAQGSDLVLHVSMYDNAPPQLADFYNALWNRAKSMPNVRFLGALTQPQWHRELASARACVYPGVNGDFAEISCIICAESQAAGTPFIGQHKGALPETLAFDAGVLVGDEHVDVNSLAYLDALADAVTQTATNDAWWASMSAGGKKRAESLDWSGVAAAWETDWTQRLRARAEDPWRMQLHLQRTGDLEAMEAA